MFNPKRFRMFQSFVILFVGGMGFYNLHTGQWWWSLVLWFLAGLNIHLMVKSIKMERRNIERMKRIDELIKMYKKEDGG